MSEKLGHFESLLNPDNKTTAESIGEDFVMLGEDYRKQVLAEISEEELKGLLEQSIHGELYSEYEKKSPAELRDEVDNLFANNGFRHTLVNNPLRVAAVTKVVFEQFMKFTNDT